MPYSSGGGSHGGGFHHSGGHSGASSYKPKPLTVTQPTRGYSRYAYYSLGHINYKYVKNTPGQLVVLIFSVIFLIPFILMGVYFALDSVHYADRLDTTSYDSEIVIDDRIDVMTASEEDELYKCFEQFKEKTGIACCIVTDCNDSWQTYYDNLEAYAYDLFVNSWDDEKHWLFVYTEPLPDSKDSNFNDWFWEGMQGDDTGDILTKDLTKTFTEDVHWYLIRGTSVSDAFILSLNNLAQDVTINTIDVDVVGLLAGCFWVIITSFILYMLLYAEYISYKRDKSQLNELKATGILVNEHALEDTCSYCSGVYIHGKHTSCPHCGAPIKPINRKQIERNFHL